MLRRGCNANARVRRRRRGDTISAPMPETFSCERARTDSVGVTPRGAHVRRSTGIIKNPVSSRQTRWASSRCRFFYRRPIHLDPLPDATIVALFGPRLGPLRTEATSAEQASDVIRMVDDIEVMANQINDASAGPEARGVAGSFRAGDDEARQSTALGGAELRRPTRGRLGAEASAALASVGSLPSPDRPPIDTEAISHHMNGNLTLQQFDGTEASSLQLSRASLWAHGIPPAGQHSL